ncbi:hypothetical protein LCGC14_0386880 [marine sediment metagenome]|uniref:TtsA-like Glycoside hydrolase family 108 domain-containing protein n=1 Tax=marine sediment metagenome TaxID=412755 RepID=A0A0F9T0Q1_9ZZZZ
MKHRQGYSWYPQYDQYRGRILQHIATIQPNFGLIATEDYMPISEAWEQFVHPICGRVWEIDDGGKGKASKALDANPEKAAVDLLDRYLRKRDKWIARAQADGRPFPDEWHLIGAAWNELNQHTTYARIVEGTKYLLRKAKQEGFPFLVIRTGVGHPSDLNPDGSVDWSAFDDPELEELIVETGSIVGLHAYFQMEGPMHSWTDEVGKLREDYPYLAGRHHGFPLQDVPIVLDETGIDGGIYNRNPRWGWKEYGVQAYTYAQMLLEAHQALDNRVLAQCPFLLDYQNDEWWSFNYVDVLDHIEEWVARIDVDIPNNAGEEPIILLPPKNQHTVTVIQREREPTDRADDNLSAFDRAMQWIFKAEGGFQKNPKDPGNWYKGELIGTKYGISAASWAHRYDIPNLTRAQARFIDYKYYWLPSGADKLDWPFSLLLFDTAVLHGVTTAVGWQEQAGQMFDYSIFARRLRLYRDSENADEFGDGWRNRLIDLLEVMANG